MTTGRYKTIGGAVLQQIVDLINNSRSRVFKNKFSPSQVYNDPKKAKLAVQWRQEEIKSKLAKAGYPRGYSFDIQDKVRLQEKRHSMTLGKKASRGVWSTEVFTIKSRLAFQPHLYQVTDSLGRPVLDRLYSKELFRVASAFD